MLFHWQVGELDVVCFESYWVQCSIVGESVVVLVKMRKKWTCCPSFLHGEVDSSTGCMNLDPGTFWITETGCGSIIQCRCDPKQNVHQKVCGSVTPKMYVRKLEEKEHIQRWRWPPSVVVVIDFGSLIFTPYPSVLPSTKLRSDSCKRLLSYCKNNTVK